MRKINVVTNQGYQNATVKRIYNKADMKPKKEPPKKPSDGGAGAVESKGGGGETSAVTSASSKKVKPPPSVDDKNDSKKSPPKTAKPSDGGGGAVESKGGGGETSAVTSASNKKEKMKENEFKELREAEIEFDLQYEDGVVVKRIKKSMVQPLDVNKASWIQKVSDTNVVEGDIVLGPHLAQLVQTLESSTIPRPLDAALSADDQKAKDKAVIKSAFGWFKVLSKAGQDGGEISPSLRVRAGMVAVLCGVAGLDVEKDSPDGAVALLHKVNTELDIWTVREYHKEFNDIPELEELTTTPFMVKIVTEILPRIFNKSHQRGDIKSLLVFGLGDAAAEIAFARLRDFRRHGFDLKIDADDGKSNTLDREAQKKKRDLLDRQSFEKAGISSSEFTLLFTELDSSGETKGAAVKKDGVEYIKWSTIKDKLKTYSKPDSKLDEVPNAFKMFLPPPLLEAGQVVRIQKALDAVNSSILNDSEATSALKAINNLANDIVEKIEAAQKKHPLEWTVDTIKDRPEEAKGEIERSAYAKKVNRELIRALRRKPTRRSLIYDEFVKMHLEREIMKNSVSRSSSGLSADGLQREATEFSRQLALVMAQKGRTKLARRNRSLLFSDTSLEDIFFSDEPKAAAARKASPTKIVTGGYISFIHKTIQENIVAEAVLAGINDAVTETMYAPSDLIIKAWLLHKHLQSRMLNGDVDGGGGADAGEDGAVGEEEEKKPDANAEEDEKKKEMQLTSTERRQLQVLFDCFLEQVASSPMAKISLDDDSAVRDFICDRLLDHPRSLMVLRAVAVVVFSCTNLCGDRFKTKLDTVRQNIWSILIGQLPRRNNGTVLHEAAQDGSVAIVQGLIFIASILINADGKRKGNLDTVLLNKTGPNQKQIIEFWNNVTAFSVGESVEFRDDHNDEWSNGKVLATGLDATARWKRRLASEDEDLRVEDPMEGTNFKMIIRRDDELSESEEELQTDKPSDYWYYFVRPQAEEGATWKSAMTIDLYDRFMRTPLYNAARRGNFGVVKLLVDCGGSVDAEAIAEVEPPIQVTPEAAMRRHLTNGNLVTHKKETMVKQYHGQDQTLTLKDQYHGLWRAAVPSKGFKDYRRCMFEVEVRKNAYLPPCRSSKDMDPFENYAIFGVGWSWESGSILFFPNCPEIVVLVHHAIGVPDFDKLRSEFRQGMPEFKKCSEADDDEDEKEEDDKDEGEEEGDDENVDEKTVVYEHLKLTSLTSPLVNAIPTFPKREGALYKNSEGVKGLVLVEKDEESLHFSEEVFLFQEGEKVVIGKFTEKDQKGAFDTTEPVDPSKAIVRTSSELTIGVAVDIQCPNEEGTGSLLFGINGQWSSLDLKEVESFKGFLDETSGDSGVEPIVIGRCVSTDLKFNTGGSRPFRFQPKNNNSSQSVNFPDQAALDNISSEGDTVLTGAAERGDAETVGLLISESSNKMRFKLTTKKESMLHLLCKHDDYENLEKYGKSYILERFFSGDDDVEHDDEGDDNDGEDESATKENDTTKAALEAASSYLRQRNTEHGDTAVHVAARNKSGEACLIAVATYLPSLLNVYNNDGLNPLQVAAEANNGKAIRALLNKELWTSFRVMYMLCCYARKRASSSRAYRPTDHQ